MMHHLSFSMHNLAFAVTAIVTMCGVHSFVIPHHDVCITNRMKLYTTTARIAIKSGSKDQHQRRPLQATAVLFLE